MNIAATSSPCQTLSLVIRAVMAVVGAAGGRGVLGGVLTLLVYRRLSGLCGRMERLAARFEAGRVWRRGLVQRGTRDIETVGSVRPDRPVRLWPCGFGWLVRLVGWQAAGYGSQLRAVLGTPEMVALLTAAPQAARILRPVCRMLAVETSVLRPRPAGVVADAAEEVAAREVDAAVKPRVRTPRAPVDWGRIPLPRGVLQAARRQGFKTGR